MASAKIATLIIRYSTEESSKAVSSVNRRFNEKLGFGHGQPVPSPPPPKEESLFDKLGSSFGHKRAEEEPPKPQTLGDKIQVTKMIRKLRRRKDS
ncbi:hypothetical protein K435DRAFT_275213 [Dendrothele bispora CBS 962.96]|uniref:Uncharacterized protein n=1 Tax=Dendrothele bispora (strain CBS 962.96) TaxID=1314807 RepID=A0A4S8LLF9_DENBC|nr:hypothetical protein K435DRAFT_275213 [Dendrothele bispora CBS 962.96]